MLLDTNGPILSEPFSPTVLDALRALEKKRKLAAKRYLFLLLVPILGVIPFGLHALLDLGGYDVVGILLTIIIFAVAAFVMVFLPSMDAISLKYKKIIMGELLPRCGIDGDFYTSHTLTAEAFLKSGLYRDKYTHMERYDNIIGKCKGVSFGLYETAMQVIVKRTSGRGGVQSRHATNQFYGWVLHVPVRRVQGKTYIFPVQRKTKAECDDWLKETGEFLLTKSSATRIVTGDATFDAHYFVCTNSPQEANAILQPQFRNVLVALYGQLESAPGFSFCEGRAYMHLGIADKGFDLPRGQAVFPPDTDRLAIKVRTFAAIAMLLHAAAGGK